MDITKNNFEQSLGLIFESINRAEIIGIDLEFTGLHLNSETSFHKYDSLEERYNKIKVITNHF